MTTQLLWLLVLLPGVLFFHLPIRLAFQQAESHSADLVQSVFTNETGRSRSLGL